MALAGPPVLVPAEGSPISVMGANNVATGDLNNDRRSDLIVVSGRSRRVTILLGQSDGRFVRLRTDRSKFLRVPTKWLSATSMATRTWILRSPVTTATTSSSCWEWPGHFSTGTGLPDRDEGRAAAPYARPCLADFNRDGKADLATVNSDNDNDVAVVLGDGRGAFTAPLGRRSRLDEVLIRSQW